MGWRLGRELKMCKFKLFPDPQIQHGKSSVYVDVSGELSIAMLACWRVTKPLLNEVSLCRETKHIHRNHWKSRGDPLQLLQLSHLTHGPTCSAAQGAHRDAHLERSRFLVDGDAAFCKIDSFTQFKRFEPTRIGSLRIMEINLLHIQWATLRDIKRKQRRFPWHIKSSDNSSPCCSRRNLPENRKGARVRLHPFLVLVFITFFQPTTFPFPFVNLLPLESLERWGMRHRIYALHNLHPNSRVSFDELMDWHCCECCWGVQTCMRNPSAIDSSR